MSIRRMLGNARASAAVEFAAVAPLFFMLMCGVIEAALLMWTQVGLQHGAQAAARCASVNPTVCGTSADIQSYAAHQAFGLNVAASTAFPRAAIRSVRIIVSPFSQATLACRRSRSRRKPVILSEDTTPLRL